MNELYEANYNMIDWFKKVVTKNYNQFEGRARRAEYWNFTLANFLLNVFLIVLIILVGYFSALGQILNVINFLIGMGLFIPSLAVAVRRLHDTNRSGLNLFWILLPIIGFFLLFIWLLEDGNRFTNKYGEDPKNPSSSTFEFEKKETIRP